ncbi:unnamed protein product [Closterium sp. NIES-54]
MASLRVLAIDHEGRPVQFDTWLDDLQLYLLSDIKDGVSLFDHVSGAATSPPTTGDGATRSQWLSRDAAARLAIHNHLPLAECAHFGQHTTAQALYDAVVARYSSPATAALGRLLLPYLFPELSAFAIVEDLVSHLRASDARYCAAVPTEAASASGKRRNGKGKGGKGSGGGSGSGGGGSRSSGGGSSGGGGGGGTGGGSGGSSGGDGCSGGSGGGGGSGTGGGGTGARRVGSRGGQCQQQQRRSETQSPQQLREWFLRGASGGGCPYVICTGDRVGQTCRRLHTQHSCFSRLDVAWRAEFGDDVELPRWADLLGSRIAIFDLDFDAILSAMHALSISAEGDCYRCVPPDPGIAAAALGASESGTLPGTVPAEALHTFTLDSGASRCFFRDSTTLTPLPEPVPVRLADPSGGPVIARSSTVLPCLAVLSGSLSGLHLPSFSTNLVSTAALQDAMVTTTTPGGQRVSICTCTRMVTTTFTRRPESSQVAASCLCRLLSHQTLLWHHRLGHPSLPRLRGMHSRLLISGLPISLPSLLPSPAPPYLPCIEGRQRAAPHSSSFPPTTAPLQTLHMDVWGPARVSRQSRERYFLLVVDDYTRYTSVFPLRSKGQVVDVLIPWIRKVRLQLRERFGQDLLALRLHSNRGVMEVARTSMIHVAAPHFLWPFAVWYAAHQLNLWPRVSLPETSPTRRWTGEVGDASVFRAWNSRAFVRDTSADKLSLRAIPCGITFDELVPFYRLFPYRSAPPPPPLLFLAPSPPQVDPLPPQGPAPLGAASGGDASGGAEPGGEEPGGIEPGVAESEGAESGDAGPRGAASSGARPRSGATRAGDAGAGGAGVTAGAGGTGGIVATGPGGDRTKGTGAAGTGGVEGAGAGVPTEPGAAGAGST